MSNVLADRLAEAIRLYVELPEESQRYLIDFANCMLLAAKLNGKKEG